MRFWVLMTFVLAVTVACKEEGGEEQANEQRFNANLNLWIERGPDTYQFTVARVCFCEPREDIVVLVVNGEVRSAFYTPSGVFLDDAELAQVTPVEGYFDIIQQAIDNDVDRLEVEYDSTLGYPTQIDIDVSEAVADDELSYSLTNLQ